MVTLATVMVLAPLVPVAVVVTLADRAYCTWYALSVPANPCSTVTGLAVPPVAEVVFMVKCAANSVVRAGVPVVGTVRLTNPTARKVSVPDTAA